MIILFLTYNFFLSFHICNLAIFRFWLVIFYFIMGGVIKQLEANQLGLGVNKF